jgi:membrane-associated protein
MNFFDVPHLQQTIEHLGFWGGLFVIWGIIFAESGLLIGFFLPGDSLLFVAGFLASAGKLDLNLLMFGSFICAVLGDNVGYATGSRFGRRLFSKEDSWLFHKKHLVTAQQFYEKHGGMAIILARFTPIVRTFAPIVAGIGAMRYRTFLIYNVVGGLLWTFGVTLLGYFLGRILPAEQLDKYLLPIVLIIIIVSLLPSVFHIYQDRKSSRH